MEEEMISYYDLLTMIKEFKNEKQYPKVYWHNNTREKVLYIPTFDCVYGQLVGYHIKNRNLESEDIRYWLSECILEGSMFDKCFEIKKEKEKSELQQEIPNHISKEFIQSLNTKVSSEDLKHIAHKVNGIINYLQHISKGKSE